MGVKITLGELAKKAGVHRSTVSLALRDHPRISLEMRQGIQALAAKHGYRVNPLVAALMQSRRRGRPAAATTLAYVTNYPTRDGWRPPHHNRPDFFPGAFERAVDLGYNLEHMWLGQPGMTPARFSAILATRGVPGVIVGRLPPGMSSMDLAWERFSAVALGMTLRSPLLHHVTENHFDTVGQCMRQCHDRGYRRVGFVFAEANDSPRVGERWLGAFLARQRLLFPPENHVQPCSHEPADEASFHEWMRAERPDAVIATHARPVLGWINRLGLEVPRDVGLIDFEHRAGTDFAGMEYDPARIGSLAVDMLVGMLHRNETGVPEDPHEVLVTGRWREGTTLPVRGPS